MGRHNDDNAPEPQSELDGGDIPVVPTPEENNEEIGTASSRGFTASLRRLDSRIDQRRALAVGSVIVLVLALFAGLVQHRRSQIPVYPDYQGAGSGSVLVEVAPGVTAASLAPKLVSMGVVKSEGAFIQAANNNPNITSMQPGFYQLRKEMAAARAVERLLDPSNRAGAVNLPGGVTLEDVRVVNGETVFGIYHHLAKASCYTEGEQRHCITATAFRNAVAHASPMQLGVPSWARHDVATAQYPARKIEGLILPGVHVFNPTHTPLEIIRELVTSSAELYQQSSLVDAAKAQKLSPYEVVVGASLIQREVGTADYGKAARVIMNRLKRHQPLQFDSTVNYGLSEQQVATSDAARATETPWNTYTMNGLPATPICSPTIEAVEAMEKPTPGKWLYFVTVDKQGTTRFNVTLKDHERDIEEAHRNGVFDSQ